MVARVGLAVATEARAVDGGTVETEDWTIPDRGWFQHQ